MPISHPDTTGRVPALSRSTFYSRAEWGGKGATLAELRDAGFPVPPFERASPDTEELARQVERLGFPLIVRSSATAEDGDRASFAGQFASFPNLRDLRQVREAIDRCHESLDSPGLRAYCQRQGIAHQTLRLHPLIQRMIEPSLSGVAFTINPLTGADELVVECCVGLGEDLLAGRQQSLRMDDTRLTAHLPRIHALARRVEQHFGSPQDIEFAIDDLGIHLLQARPITRVSFTSEVGEWTNADFRDGGVSSTVCSPLMWSLYETIWNDVLKVSLQELRLWTEDFEAGRMFYGRPYWNLGAVKRAVARIPGFVEREFDEDLSVLSTYVGDGVRTPVNPRTVWRAIPTLLALPGFFRRRRKDAEHLLTRAPEFAIQWEHQSLGKIDEFRRLIEVDFRQIESTYFRTIYAVSLAKLDWKESFPQCEYAPLMAGLPPLSHMEPERRLRDMHSQGSVDISRFSREFGHHSRWGIDIRHPRWDEEPEFLAELAERGPDNSSPVLAASGPRAMFEAARVDALRQVPWWKRPSFERKLERLRRFVWLREELRDLSSRIYYWIRRHALALSDARHLGEEIFFQTFPEIFEDDRRNIEARRETFMRFRNFSAPNEIGHRYQHDLETTSGELRGIAAAVGRARGTAHIAANVSDAMSATQNTILVCPFTEPGWIPVLGRVAGVVTETGGQLSHAAVICREFGIPAVLGVSHATRRIPHGSLVEIDGGSGIVQIVHD